MRRAVIRVDEHVEIAFADGATPQTEGEAARLFPEIDVPSRAVPVHVTVPEAAAGDGEARLSERDEALEEAKHVAVLLEPAPVEPGRFVVLVVGVVVAPLGV